MDNTEKSTEQNAGETNAGIYMTSVPPTPNPLSQPAGLPKEENTSSVGAIIGTIIIIAIIILGGLYFWGKRIEEINTQATIQNEEESAYATGSEASAIKNVSPSDDLSSIEADLQQTNTQNLDAELK